LSEQRKYRSWTAQQKLEIVLAGLRGDRSVRDVCREHAISETLYYGWRDQLLEAGKERFAGKEERQGDRELRRKVAELATRSEQRHIRIAETERREPCELGAQLERETCASRQHRINVRCRTQVVVDQEPCRVLGERRRERGHVLRCDRQTCSGAVTAPAPEQCRTRAERAVQVE